MGDAKCLTCHTVVADLIKADRGFHSSAVAKKQRCLQCHNEHHGRDFELVRFNPTGFDHAQAKYSLSGKHRGLSCGSCHRAKFIRDETLKSKKGTYLGLSKKCLGCHDRYHEDDTGEDCGQCHSFKTFSM